MKRSLKRILTVLCSVALVISLLPTSAFAATMKSAKAKTAYLAYTDANWTSNTDVAMPDGWKAKDAKIKGEGKYTVGLDFTGTADGAAKGLNFAALLIKNGEKDFAGYCIKINTIKINGKSIKFKKGFTSSDDGIETRMNIYNQWVADKDIDVTKIRSWDGKIKNVTAQIADTAAFDSVKTITVTFTLYKEAKKK